MREKADHGERVALAYFPGWIADKKFLYQMVWWPESAAHAFDVVFLAYPRARVESNALAAAVWDLSHDDDYDSGPPDHCLLLEAKTVAKCRGQLRSYLRTNPRHGDRQMSISWIKRAASCAKPNWVGELVLRYLAAGKLRRGLIVKVLRDSTVLYWDEEEFVIQNLDSHTGFRVDPPSAVRSTRRLRKSQNS